MNDDRISRLRAQVGGPRDGALLRSHDSTARGGPVADTRFHVDIPLSSTQRKDVVIRVEHDRPLSAAAPRTAGLDALPEHRVLTEDSALRVRLTATCSPGGTISVRGEHSITKLRHLDLIKAQECS